MQEFCDRVSELRARKDEITRELKTVAEELDAAESTLLGHMAEVGVDSVVVNGTRYTKSVAVSPTLNDYDALLEHIRKTGAFDLLQRRLSSEAVKQRWDAGVGVPGVGWYDKVGLRVTKR